MKITKLSLNELQTKLASKELSRQEITQAYQQNIDDHEKAINSFIATRDISNLNDATRTDPENQPLAGIPFAVKDTYVSNALPTTAASKVLDSFAAPYQATVIDRLEKAGGVLIGKNNQDAWGHGGSSENTDFEPVNNPWNLDHSAGGSSGGSAASVAARMVPFSIGEDTGGSIRNPAAMCNVTGLKVSYGLVPRWGSIAYASSLDTVGPIAKSAEDVATVLDTIAGPDRHDATSQNTINNESLSYTKVLKKNAQPQKIGLPKEFLSEDLNSEVKKCLDATIKELEKLGHEFVEVSLPTLQYSISIYYVLALSETSSNLARLDGVRYGGNRELFTPETMRRILLGTFSLSTGYADELYHQAQKARTLLIQDYQAAFNTVDVMLAPVTVGPAPQKGALIDDPVQNMLADLYTVSVNLVGSPSLAFPAGFSDQKLPIGLQLIGKRFDEARLLQIINDYQQATLWHKEIPPLLEE